MLDKLRKDWEKLDGAKEFLEDGPIDWLEDDDVEELCKILKKCEQNIRDILSVKELAALKECDKNDFLRF